MDTQRLILFIVFAFSALFLWEAWQKQQRPAPPAAPAQQAAPAGAPGAPAVPGAPSASGVPTPSAPAGAPAAQPASPAAPGAVPGQAVAGGERLRIRTDTLDAEISTLGGQITRLALLKHGGTVDHSQPYQLLSSGPGHVHIAQSGLIGEGLPNHNTLYTAEPGPRELEAGKDALEVRLSAPLAGGGKVEQVITFRRGSYLVDVAYEITNGGSAPIEPFAYFQLLRDHQPPPGQSDMVPTYTGPVVYNEIDKYKKVDFGDIDKGKTPYTARTDNGWVAMVEHYFVAAWLPRDSEPKLAREFYTKKRENGLYAAGVIVPAGAVQPGSTLKVGVPLYAGPQEQEKLATLAKGLDLTVDYGIFHVIAYPLFLLLSWLHGMVGNWGWAIIALTILIKLVFYPLNAASARSMAKMKVIGPKLKSLQEQYANDKQQLQIKMMELYKQEKINPLGGCLPILVQIPVFIALYWVLLGAVELRHAPWILWIKDLAGPDPYFILPVLYALSAWFMVKLQPPSPGMDPMQQKIMQYMPMAFSVLFVFFPAGLVLYWFVQNLLSAAQQWHVNRMLQREAEAAAARRR